jgi:hypothetical protein
MSSGASHEAFLIRRLLGAGCAGSPASTPGAELAASASEPQSRAESWEALPSQLQPKSHPAPRGGVTGARGGVLGRGEEGREGGVESWAAATPPGRSGLTDAGHPSKVCDCGVGFPLGNPVLPAPCASAPEFLLYLKPPGNFAQLDSTLKSQGLGVTGRPSLTPGSPAPARSLRSLRSLFCPGCTRSARIQRSPFGKMTPLGKRGEAVTGLRATWERGRLLPLPTERAAGVSTADSASVPQPLGGWLQGCGGRWCGLRLLTPLSEAPQTLLVFFSTSPHSEAGAVDGAACGQGWGRCGIQTEEESRAGWGLRTTEEEVPRPGGLSGLLSTPAL